uniref:Uncharacterized protein n=1 Tax=Anguilla anguilla TaxID=7936 RepID=A0A0E9UZR9_ANGAN
MVVQLLAKDHCSCPSCLALFTTFAFLIFSWGSHSAGISANWINTVTDDSSTRQDGTQQCKRCERVIVAMAIP